MRQLFIKISNITNEKVLIIREILKYFLVDIKREKYRAEIDGLRAFAVTAVIINHFNKDIIPHGYLGVDMFFVISGFVITSSLSRPTI